jgi:putative DNA primase/helicase
MSLEDKRDDFYNETEHDEAVAHIKPNVGALKEESITEIKRKTLNNLLAKIKRVDFYKVCEALGWKPSQSANGSDNPPTQSNYKVAIIDELMKSAKSNNWHLALDSGLFYIYTGCMWISLDKYELKNFLKEVAIKQGYPPIKAKDSKFIVQLYDQAIQDGFFTDKHYTQQSMINLSNFTLVLNSDGVKTKKFDYRDFLTHQLPFNYDPKAHNAIFQKYLDDVLPDKDTQRTLQETCGYLFIKGLKLEKVFFLYGTGANGKSVLFEVINGLIGDENISHYSLESLTDNSGYFRAKIKDKIVNYGTDIKLTKIDAGLFKTLASGEPVEARLPYFEPFTMSGYAKLIFNVNRLDNANIEHTHGFYRRILIIPFDKTIADDKQDKSLHKKILNNKAGVLNWIIAGAKRVIENEDIFISQECHKFKAKFIKETDSVALFLDDSGYEASEISTVYLSNIYADYKDFCTDDGYRSLGKNNFGKRLQALGMKRKKDNHNKDCFKMVKKFKL